MKKVLLTCLLGTILVLSLSPAAKADSFITVSVNGGAATTFSGVGDTLITGTFTVSGVTFTNITLDGNQPGGSAAFATDTKTAVTNNTAAVVNVSVGFASNNYVLPAGSPLTFNGSQTVNVANFNGGGAISQNFTGRGDTSNSLVPGTGVAAVAPICTVAPGGPTNSCATSSPLSSFTRTGNFGLNGVETFSLAPGQTSDFSGSINAVGPAAPVPEPSSVLLLGSGMLFLAGRRLRRK